MKPIRLFYYFSVQFVIIEKKSIFFFGSKYQEIKLSPHECFDFSVLLKFPPSFFLKHFSSMTKCFNIQNNIYYFTLVI